MTNNTIFNKKRISIDTNNRNKISYSVESLVKLLSTYDIKKDTFTNKTYVNDNLLNETILNDIENEIYFFTNWTNNNVSSNYIYKQLESIAIKNSYNSLCDYFSNLKPSSTDLLNNWTSQILGCEDNKLNRIIGRKWLISGIARALNPGCKIEGCLVLTGQQGCGKSTFFKTICPNPDWFYDGTVNLSNDQLIANTYSGKFIIEFSELASLKKENIETVKSHLTKCEDSFVQKYKVLQTTLKRQVIFGGSTNQREILTDLTGNRRFWILECNVINNNLLQDIKNDLWAEALFAYKNGEKHYLEDSEVDLLSETNKTYMVSDPVEDILLYNLNHYKKKEYRSCEILDWFKNMNLNHVARRLKILMENQGFKKVRRSYGWTFIDQQNSLEDSIFQQL